MTDVEVEELRQWALDRMAWARAYAKIEGDEIEDIELPELLLAAIQEKDFSAASKMIEMSVRDTYNCQEAA